MTITPDATSPARLHPVGGTYNFRDVGGYRAATGVTRWGKLFRSDALHRLDDRSRELLDDLRIKQIIDLRDASERESAPSLLDGLDIEVHHLPIFDQEEPHHLALSSATLGAVYERMIDQHAGNLVRAIGIIADSGADGVLVHCTAGKDRTGMVIALALLAVDVDRDDVVSDYAVTEEYLRGEWATEMRSRVAAGGTVLSAELNELISASPAALLEQILDRIDDHHGSVREYLRRAGLEEASEDRLRTTLLEPSVQTS